MRKPVAAMIAKLRTYLTIALSLVLLALLLGLPPQYSANAQGNEDARSAMQAALEVHVQTLQIPYNAVLITHYVQGNWAYGNAGYVHRDTGDFVATEPFVVLARRGVGRAWQALVPSKEVAGEYNRWLDEIPSALISDDDKVFLRIPENQPDVIAEAAVTGYKLPWAGGWGATLTKGPHSGGSHAGIWAWDFDLWQGQWDGMVGQSGYVASAKDGVVVFAKDVSGLSCGLQSCAGYANVVIIQHAEDEYSWYYHLDQDSIPAHIKKAKKDGTWIRAGTIIGMEGKTGYCLGTNLIHLHFMVTDDVDLNQYDENNVYRAPWPDPDDTLEVDFEDWDELPYSDNYLNPSNGVVLYWDADYKGPSMKFTCSGRGMRERLPDFLRYRASSIRVTPEGEYFAALYSDTNGDPNEDWYCRGWWWTEANFDNDYCDPNRDGGAMNDAISSVKMTTKEEYCSQFSGGSGLTTGLSAVQMLGNDAEDFCGHSSTTDSATFVSDITIPDDTFLSPGQSFNKIWRMRNSGTSTWGSGYQLVFVGGDQMGAPSAVSVPTTAPGSTADISVSMTAPTTQGTYQGNWRMRNAQGVFFGDTIWVRVSVESPGSHITVLSFDPPSPSNAQLVRIHAKAEEVSNFRAMRLKIDGGVVYELGAPEFTFDWDTSSYNDGGHSVVVEVADWSDLSWSQPERRGATYTLLEGRAPANHAPNKPSPASPYDWYVYYSGNTAQLCAQANGDPDGDSITSYYFDIHESAQLWNSGWVGGNCATTSALGPYNYQWRVKVRDSRGAESEWSDSWHFTIVNPNLSVSELYFEPQDGNSEQVKIRACTTGQGGVGITMRVSANDANDGSGNGTWHIIKELGVPCFNEIDAPIWHTLAYGDGPHRVRVEAHGVNTGWDGAAVREEVYTLPHRRPASPELVGPGYQPYSQPATKVWLNSRTITFNWKVPVVNATEFTIRARTDSNLDLPGDLLDQPHLPPTQNSFTHTFGDDHPDIWWMVRAINDRGYNDSARLLLGIDRVAPSAAVQPLAEAVSDSTFLVGWSGSDDRSGVLNYDIQVRDGERGEWTDWLIETESTFALFSGQNGHTYYFRARALDKAGNLGAYAGGDGDNHTRVDPTIVPPPPWWNASYTWRRNLVVLNNDARTLPAGYPMHLHFEGTVATQIYNASRSDGNDVRIVLNNSSELHRIIQNFSPSIIDIWFRAQSDLSPGASDSTTYQLYYGSPGAGAPPADPNQVWFPNVDGNTVAYYAMQEGSGSTVYDTSGYGRHCAIADSSVSWSTSKFGRGLYFSAPSGDHRALDCPQFSSPTAFTIEFWLDRQGDGRLAGQLKPAEHPDWLFHLLDGHLGLDIWPCPPCGSSGVHTDTDLRNPPYAGKWNHIAVTFNGGNEVRFYINGSLDSIKNLSQSGINTYANALQIGSVEGINQIKGWMSHFRFSNVVRTSFPYGSFGLITNEPTLGTGEATQYQPPQPPADLAVGNVAAFPAYADAGGGTIVQAVVTNQGAGPTQNGFWIDLYADHQPTGPGDLTGSIRYWVASPIEAGTTISLTTLVTESTVSGSGLAAQGTGPQETTQVLYGQADSTGVLSESDEGNNISSGIEVCFASADDYETDDSVDTAVSITTDGITQTHNCHAVGDQDWFEFNAETGLIYTPRTENLGLSADTYLYLYDTNGTTFLAANDDYGGTLASQITWKAPADGTYYVLAKHWNPNVGGCGTSYDFSICGLYGDLDGDRQVTIADIMQVASRWRCKCDGPCYDPFYDMDGDCDIDVVDIMMVVVHWGETCVLRETPSPTPTPTNTPTPTPTPPSTPVNTPTNTPTPTATPTSTPTLTPTPTPTYTPTPTPTSTQTPTPTPNPVFGDGSDGDLTVASGETRYADDIRTALSGNAPAGQRTIPVASTSGFAAGREILIIQMQGTGVGLYEFGTIENVSSGSLTLVQNLANTYTVGGNSKAQVLRVSHYKNVTVQSEGTLTAHAWDGNTGGILVLRASGTFAVQNGGLVSLMGGNGSDAIGSNGVYVAQGGVGGGFRGGNGYRNHDGITGMGWQGESVAGPGGQSRLSNANGGGGGHANPDQGHAGGGGGGNGTDGSQGGANCGGFYGGAGGASGGTVDLSNMILGGGGGGGNTNYSYAVGGGGAGGGIILVASFQIAIAGSVTVNGGNAGHYDIGGGGGAGGSVLMRASTASVGDNRITALGGAGGGAGCGPGGAGGVGRIRIEYCEALSGFTNPPASIRQTCPVSQP